AFGLGEAIKRARELYAQDGKAPVLSEAAVKAWGYSTLNGASLRVLGALRQYGLLEDPAPKTVRLSPRALTIILEEDGSPDRAMAIREAALAPPVFSELLEHYGGSVPSEGTAVSHLVRNDHFNEDAARSLIAAWRDTLDLVQVVSATDITSRNDGHGVGGRPDLRADDQRQPTQPRLQTEGERMEFTWPLSGNAVATMTVTRELEPDDIETLAAYFEIAKKALSKAARPKPLEGGDTEAAKNA
ncbi:MAG TPA: hypothetical protein VFD73_09545, partial [Gemmatimonadales bacterium]|nr:hypothetical protein [Gemmatimonadales bacterium]